MKKNTRSADFCADRIDVITNFAVITNVVIKRVRCTLMLFLLEALMKSVVKTCKRYRVEISDERTDLLINDTKSILRKL